MTYWIVLSELTEVENGQIFLTCSPISSLDITSLNFGYVFIPTKFISTYYIIEKKNLKSKDISSIFSEYLLNKKNKNIIEISKNELLFPLNLTYLKYLSDFDTYKTLLNKFANKLL